MNLNLLLQKEALDMVLPFVTIKKKGLGDNGVCSCESTKE